jgi:heat shock protein HslJ
MKFLFLGIAVFYHLFTNAQSDNNLSGTKWVLIKAVNRESTKSQYADSTCRTTLNFDHGQFYGFSGWNNFSGRYAISGKNELKMFDAVQTLMAGPPNCEFGETIGQHFTKVKSFMVKADTLIIFTNDSIKIFYNKIK